MHIGLGERDSKGNPPFYAITYSDVIPGPKLDLEKLKGVVVTVSGKIQEYGQTGFALANPDHSQLALKSLISPQLKHSSESKLATLKFPSVTATPKCGLTAAIAAALRCHPKEMPAGSELLRGRLLAPLERRSHLTMTLSLFIS
jgi:hypothetical protein